MNMNQNIKISVIIPVYNMEKYLRECLNSVTEQSLKDIEIILINDGSTDNSIQIIREYEQKDSRIVVIDKKNEGVGKARNDGIHKAIGEFVAFMDSDDLYADSLALERLYTAAKENNTLVSGGKMQMLRENGEFYSPDGEALFGVEFVARRMTLYEDFQYDYGYWQYIYNRELLLENQLFFPRYSRFQDPPFFVKAMTLAKEFYMINETVYTYRCISSESKFTTKKTIDFLHGIIDNLTFSQEKKLAKLHYITAMRLDKEGSFMASKSISQGYSKELFYMLIRASHAVNEEWLKREGYELDSPFVPNFFEYLTNTTGKYERLREKKYFKVLAALAKKARR